MPSIIPTEDTVTKKSSSPLKIIVTSTFISILSSVLIVFLAFSYWPTVNQPPEIQYKTIVKDTGIDAQTIYSENDESTITAVEKVGPSVVSIVVSQTVDPNQQLLQNDPFYRFFGPNSYSMPGLQPLPENNVLPQENPSDNAGNENNDTAKPEEFTVARGTGFIISTDGYIITNKHVVSQTDAHYKAVLNDGTEYDATLLDTDPLNDIAVLKIEAEGLVAAELGNSDDIHIGQTVIAIGNSLGEYNNSVTKGVVSAIDRSIQASDGMGSYTEALENIIQTDAAINPGNSGGPLIDLEGKVIGINTAIDKAGQSIGFALPINDATYVVDSIKQFGKVVRPFLGVRYMVINETLQNLNDLQVDYGALIIRGETPEALAVIPGSPADIAGLTENDIILEINGEKISQDTTLIELLQKYKPGDNVTLKVLSKGEEKTLTLTLGESNPQQ